MQVHLASPTPNASRMTHYMLLHRGITRLLLAYDPAERSRNTRVSKAALCRPVELLNGTRVGGDQARKGTTLVRVL